MVVELYPHQQKAVDELDNGKILWGGVGTGKTITALVYFFTKVCGGVVGDFGSMRTPVDLYIITTAKKRDSLDWEKDCAALGLGSSPISSVEGINVTVDSWNNIGKYVDVKGAFFVFDEQRVVGSGTWVDKFIKITKNNRWILLSATPGDTWIDYIPVFVANGFVKNRTEFKRNHVVYSTFTKFPKIERYLEVGKLVRWRNQILVHMPYQRHTTRIVNHVEVDYDYDLFEKAVKKRWHVFEERPLRDVAELFSVMRKVVNSDSSRVRVLKELMEKHPKLIVFYNFDYELEMLRSLSESHGSPSQSFSETGTTRSQASGTDQNPNLSELEKGVCVSGVFPESQSLATSSGKRQQEPSLTKLETNFSTATAMAEWNGHKHQEIPTTDRWVYLVQYVAGAEGWNCVETDAICFFSLTYSYKNFEQAQGRIDRLNTPFSDLHYYVLRSRSPIDLAIWKALSEKKNFNESDLGYNL